MWHFKMLKIYNSLYWKNINASYFRNFHLIVVYFSIFILKLTWHIFLNSHFSFYLCEKDNVIISKVHYESIVFFKSPFFKKSTKFYCNMDNFNFNKVNAQIWLYILSSFLIQKNYDCNNPNKYFKFVFTLLFKYIILFDATLGLSNSISYKIFD